jgi:quinoprotein relay system zinc metallohydrolase 2
MLRTIGRYALPGMCLFAANLAASGADNFAIEEVASGIYLHRGQIAGLDDPARADSANIGFIVGATCIAVIDTGGALSTGRKLAAAIATVSDKPVCYVINTHVHFDHVLGNRAFVGVQAHFAGHENLRPAIAASRDFLAAAFAVELGASGQQAAVIAPEVLVADQLEIDLGERRLLLQAVANAHTTTDLTVYDVSSATLWSGDLLFRERLPILDGSLLGWLQWMDENMRESYALVIPGHGPTDRNWPQGALRQYEYLSVLRDETRTAIATGMFVEDAKAVVAITERARWRLSDRAHGLNVSRAYRELEWE